MKIERDWNPPAAFPHGKFEGAPSDVGRAHGRTFGEQVQGSIRVHKGGIEKTGLAWSDALAWADKGRALMQLVDPRLAEELDGIATGAEVDRRELYAINFRVVMSRLARQAELETQTHECTTAAALGSVTANGHTLLAQNWDNKSELQANLVVIEQRTAGEPALLFVTEAGRLFLHGMNDAGVGIVGNALACDRPTQPEKSGAASGVRRRALRHTSLAAAHRVIIDSPHGTSGNHLLADSTGVAVDVEAIPDGCFSLEPEDGIIAHSNHFLHPEAKAAITDTMSDVQTNTVLREARLRTALLEKRGALTISDVQSALRDHDGYPVSVCSHPHPTSDGRSGHTLSSTVMDLNEGRMFVAPGPACLSTYTEYRFS